MRVSFGVHIAIFPSLLPDPLSMYRFSALQRERTASSCARSVLKAFLESELIMYIRPSLDPAQILLSWTTMSLIPRQSSWILWDGSVPSMSQTKISPSLLQPAQISSFVFSPSAFRMMKQSISAGWNLGSDTVNCSSCRIWPLPLSFKIFCQVPHQMCSWWYLMLRRSRTFSRWMGGWAWVSFWTSHFMIIPLMLAVKAYLPSSIETMSTTISWWSISVLLLRIVSMSMMNIPYEPAQTCFLSTATRQVYNTNWNVVLFLWDLRGFNVFI